MPLFDTSDECRRKLDEILIKSSRYNLQHEGSQTYNTKRRAYCIDRLMDGLETGESEIEIFAYTNEEETTTDILIKEIADCICFGLVQNFTKINTESYLWNFTWRFHDYEISVETFSFLKPAILKISGLTKLRNAEQVIFHTEQLQDLLNDYRMHVSDEFFEIIPRKFSYINRGMKHTPVEFCLFMDLVFPKKNNAFYRRADEVPGFPIPRDRDTVYPGNFFRGTDHMNHLAISDFFRTMANLICKEKDPDTGELVSKVENFIQTRQHVLTDTLHRNRYDIQIKWRFKTYSFHVFKKHDSYWFLRIESDTDSLLDSMFSCTQSLNARLSRLEALFIASN
jgi:hypothetical protein